MGYTTDFSGCFKLDRPLEKEHKKYLIQFSRTVRVKRDQNSVSFLPDPIREEANLPVGIDGEFFVGAKGDFGQDMDSSILDISNPPSAQPSLWCHWSPDAKGTSIIWNDGEKFYEYAPWINYLIKNFFQRWGYVLNGTVKWRGEVFSDTGEIVIKNNQVTTDER